MLPALTRAQQAAKNASPALRFVLMVGIMSFFADFTYEGSRSITGPYLGLLGAGAFTVSVVSGAPLIWIVRARTRAPAAQKGG